jgi:hypothetical protein
MTTKKKTTARERELKAKLDGQIEINQELHRQLNQIQKRLDERARSVGAMRATMEADRYKASLVEQERNALRRVIVVLVEAGTFPEPRQLMTVAFNEINRTWEPGHDTTRPIQSGASQDGAREA